MGAMGNTEGMNVRRAGRIVLTIIGTLALVVILGLSLFALWATFFLPPSTVGWCC